MDYIFVTFNSELILNLQENYKNTTEVSSIPFTQISPMLSFISMAVPLVMSRVWTPESLRQARGHPPS